MKSRPGQGLTVIGKKIRLKQNDHASRRTQRSPHTRREQHPVLTPHSPQAEQHRPTLPQETQAFSNAPNLTQEYLFATMRSVHLNGDLSDISHNPAKCQACETYAVPCYSDYFPLQA